MAEWAIVMRYLKSVAPNSPDGDALFAELEALHGEYARLVKASQHVAIGRIGAATVGPSGLAAGR